MIAIVCFTLFSLNVFLLIVWLYFVLATINTEFFWPLKSIEPAWNSGECFISEQPMPSVGCSCKLEKFKKDFMWYSLIELNILAEGCSVKKWTTSLMFSGAISKIYKNGICRNNAACLLLFARFLNMNLFFLNAELLITESCFVS